MSTLNHWRGLKDLVVDGVTHGAEAVKKLQLETVRRPIEILEQIPPLAGPAKVVQAVHAAVVTTTHASIQVVTAIASAGVDVALDVAEKAKSD